MTTTTRMIIVKAKRHNMDCSVVSKIMVIVMTRMVRGRIMMTRMIRIK